MTTGETTVPAQTFRAVPLAALVGVVFLAVGMSPLAFLGGPWYLLFLLPLGLAWWVLRSRTVVDADALRVVSVVGARRVAWSDVETLRVTERGWVRAVRTEGAEVALTGVRTRDLGRVGQASGGRITMPTPEEVEAAEEHARELAAMRMRIERLRASGRAEDDGTPDDGTLDDGTLDDGTAGGVGGNDSAAEDSGGDGGRRA